MAKDNVRSFYKNKNIELPTAFYFIQMDINYSSKNHIKIKNTQSYKIWSII